MATPFLGPLDPSKPLPPISTRRKGILTGVICQSPKCFNKPPHSTKYFSPTYQPNAPLIGISCPFGGYFRTYFRSLYHESLINHNRQFTQKKKRKRDQTDNDYGFAMELQNLLNNADKDDAPSPHFTPFTPNNGPTPVLNNPPPRFGENQTGSRLISGSQCGGVHGRTAVNHQNRRNNACNAKACFECCIHLNAHTKLCVPHTTQAKAKLKPKQPRAGHEGTVIDLTLTQTPRQQHQQTQRSTLPGTQADGGSFVRVCDQNNAFRSLAIKHQADERRENEEMEKANSTVTMVVWAAPNNHHGDPVNYEIWREYIPNWPRFQLDHSEDLKELVQLHIGAPSNQRLQVWSDAEQHWVGLRLSILEMYPEDCRRILIKFPSLTEAQCKDFKQQVELVNTLLHGPDLSIEKLAQPDPGCPPLHLLLRTTPGTLELTPPSSPTRHPSSSPIAIVTPDAMQQTPSLLPASASASIEILSTQSTSTIDNENPIVTKPSKWPSNIRMKLMLQFLELSTGPQKLNIPTAWKRVFGGLGLVFVPSTASLYRRWLMDCDKGALVAFINANPNSVAQDALIHFEDVWKECRYNNAEKENAGGSDDKNSKSGGSVKGGVAKGKGKAFQSTVRHHHQSNSLSTNVTP
ncbi:hypothetical protein DFH28DRAFT_1196521 [Melampsora americana]|nr:hypothetical protein DFH28DRAFT_1196521 [Melampsora americana]